jgi:hypothetical protein
MIGELLYSIEVTVVRCPGDDLEGGAPGPVEVPLAVRYCDICRRWGATGSTHVCWRNWSARLSDLLVELARRDR